MAVLKSQTTQSVLCATKSNYQKENILIFNKHEHKSTKDSINLYPYFFTKLHNCSKLFRWYMALHYQTYTEAVYWCFDYCKIHRKTTAMQSSFIKALNCWPEKRQLVIINCGINNSWRNKYYLSHKIANTSIRKLMCRSSHPEVFFKIQCSLKSHKIRRKAPAPESLFKKDK